MSSINEPDRWLGVEFRHLAALQAVAEHGSFGRAALALGYTQSAISQQIATLERAVGERLLERPGGPRAVTPTEAGRLLLSHAEAIVARLRAAQADLAALADGAAGSLCVASFQSVGARVVPRLLRAYRRTWPAIDVRLIEAEHGHDLEVLLERGEVDLSFVMPPLASNVIETADLLHDPYVLLVPADDELAGRSSFAVEELGGKPLVGYRSCPTIHQLETTLELRGLVPNVVFRSDDNGTLQGLVAAGMGYAILPLLAVDVTNDETAVVPLTGDFPPRVISIGWHRDRYRSAAARAFVEAAHAACAEIARTHASSHGVAVRAAAG
jgi:DNA-binding transcriptional LysR family regulator